MTVRTDFPRKTKVLRDVFIPMKDGTRLAAQIWLPVDAETDKVPAILEYLPYRKRDGTVERDALTHPYYAGFGYAGVRVDIRGTGDSDGILYDEYSRQEQDDALEVIAWLAKQPWSNGNVGMIGISWGGFNGLQVAARRPKALKAVVSICSTDDRYADDIHCMGGCLLVDKVNWGSTMLSILATPPDPELVGHNRWKDMWVERMGEHALWLADWHKHQRRDAFYRHGSVCEDYSRIECPVYMVGGWADGYSNAVFRFLAGHKGPRKGLVGPWAHKYPHFADPGPRIGFLQETIRWFDQHLKGKETGIMDEPMLRCWVQEPMPPRTLYGERPGRWVAEEQWPSPRIEGVRHALGEGTLGGVPAKAKLSIHSPLTVGEAAGKWCPYGLVPDQPGDQRIEAGGSLVFDSEVLKDAVEILGAPVAHLELSSDKPVAMVAAVLSEVLPDGAATRVSFGLLNLTHRDGHVDLKPLEPGKKYKVKVRLNEAGHHFGRGNRIRLALSTSYWPIAWPAPEPVTLTIHTGGSALELPVRPDRKEDRKLKPFPPAETAAPLKETALRQASSRWTVERDLATGVVTNARLTDDGSYRLDEIDLVTDDKSGRMFVIHPDDPLSAKVEHWTEKSYARGRFKARARTEVRMRAEREHFVIEARLDAFEGEQPILSRTWSKRIKRDLV
jgi:hypothetical protein